LIFSGPFQAYNGPVFVLHHKSGLKWSWFDFILGGNVVKNENEKSFSLRVDADILAKFRYASGYAGRSANSQIIQLMLMFIAKYEKEHGKIELNTELTEQG